MITVTKGDLFTIKADAIGHGVNCEGVMGAGIAKVFKAKWPAMYEDYRSLCNAGVSQPGDADFYITDTGQAIVNLFTQDVRGPNARAEWVRLALANAASFIYKNLSSPDETYRFAIPLVGCGIGGLDFEDLYAAVELADMIWGESIEFIVVYNDDNEDAVPLDHRV